MDWKFLAERISSYTDTSPKHGSRQLIYSNMDWWDVAEQPPRFEDLPGEFAEAFKLWNLDAEHNHQRICDLLHTYIYALFITENFDDWTDLFSRECGAEYSHSEIRLVGVDFCQAPLPRVKTEALVEVVCAVSLEAVEKSMEDQGVLLADGISFGWNLPEDDGEIDLTFGNHQGVEAHFTDDTSLESA